MSYSVECILEVYEGPVLGLMSLTSLLNFFGSENKMHKVMGCLSSWDEPHLSLAH